MAKNINSIKVIKNFFKLTNNRKGSIAKFRCYRSESNFFRSACCIDSALCFCNIIVYVKFKFVNLTVISSCLFQSQKSTKNYLLYYFIFYVHFNVFSENDAFAHMTNMIMFHIIITFKIVISATSCKLNLLFKPTVSLMTRKPTLILRA